MSILRVITMTAVLAALAACERSGGSDDVVDSGIVDGGPLKDGVANVWVDPDGCQHWYIDDGIEGFMTPRLNRDGTPRCQDTRGSVTLKDGTVVQTEQEPVNIAS
ncbi:hypothetical protein [Cognatiyoonia sp. IB215182]|uniref:hypothetical protein n=1 Tax=Cognatiyoonia sp. IB215182 TaxID=3097353 RepID=UPI002A0BE740|nr:hypothetical protein [Cognatiyoonia sp. IB215182]MDX8351573.1 hypothetical protein [Cognatiyoonia sp. IB215182]